MKIFTENIRVFMETYSISTYDEIAIILNINPNTLKSWLSGQRAVSLRKLDYLANGLNLPSYLFIQKSANLRENILLSSRVINNSILIFSNNLKLIFINSSKVTWGEREALFYGQIGASALMSYTRDKSPRIPPLDKLDLMAECLGIEVHLLIKEDAFK